MENGKWQMDGGERAGGKVADIPTRAFEFGVRIIRLCRYLDAKPGTSRTLASQLLRSGTSVGANVEEGQAGHSRADFIAKYTIALKEARETRYRLRLLAASALVPPKRIASLVTEAQELCRMIARAILTARRNRAADK
jgi:four helix bundle protein